MNLSVLCIFLPFQISVIFFSAMEASFLYKSQFSLLAVGVQYIIPERQRIFGRTTTFQIWLSEGSSYLKNHSFVLFSMIRYSVLTVGLQVELAHPRQFWIHLYKWSEPWSHLIKKLLRIIHRNENATLYIIWSLLCAQAITFLQTLQVIFKKLLLAHLDKALFRDFQKTFFCLHKS